MPLYDEPMPSPFEDLPEGVALLMALSREATAREVVRSAHEGVKAAQAYADHVSSVAVAMGTLNYADVAAASGVSRQAARQRYRPSVEHAQAEMDAVPDPFEQQRPRAVPVAVPADGFTWGSDDAGQADDVSSPAPACLVCGGQGWLPEGSSCLACAGRAARS